MLLRKKEDIEDWLNEYKIVKYNLIPNREYGYVVNVNKSVDISNYKLKSIDIKFNEINGLFDCSFNQLSSLEGCPNITNGFLCAYNELISLESCPTIVNGDFDCSNNQLNSLKYAPKKVNGFYCGNNRLTIEGLEYLPKEIKSNFILLIENESLNSLQEIKNFKDLNIKIEDIFKIQKEKENLLNIINKKECKNKKINKI